MFSSLLFLRRVLKLDAASCAATGALQVAAAPALAGLFGLPQPLLIGTGLFMLVYAAAVLWLSLRASVSRVLVWVVIAGNCLWAIDCVWLLASGQVAATALGQTWVLMQAVVVVVLAGLQWLGLRGQAR
jgi:hypothetical protein